MEKSTVERSLDASIKDGASYSVMVGLGEEHDELVATFKDLQGVGCQILTIGQYLRPSSAHAPMSRYYHPDEFRTLKQIALDLGFVHVESGPLVRSSYHAHETADAWQVRDPQIPKSKWWLSDGPFVGFRIVREQ